LTLRGTADQIALAGWLFPELDRFATGQSAPQASQNPATLEYRLAGIGDGVVRVFYLTHTETPMAIQEVVNALRAILEFQRAVVWNASKAVVLRGTAEQIAAAEWLIKGLDKPAGMQPPSQQGRGPAVAAYTLSDARAPAVRVFYPAHTQTPQAMQEMVNSVRSLSELQRVIVCNGPRAIAVRGTPGQVATAEWLIDALDKPAGAVSSASQSQTPAPNQYQLAESGDVARVFYLAHTATPQELQDLLNLVRSTTNIQRATFCSVPGALALRGTAGQVALAGKLIQEKDKL
jgi:hypothetical protein